MTWQLLSQTVAKKARNAPRCHDIFSELMGEMRVRTMPVRAVVLVSVLAIFQCASAHAGDSLPNVGLDKGDWYASFGPTILTRSTPSSGTIIGATGGGTPPFRDASVFHFGWAAGWDAAIGAKLPWNNDHIDFRFLNVDSISASDSFASPGNFIGVGFTGPAGTSFAGTYQTKLTSGELNWRHALTDRIGVLAGLRYLSMNDDLRYTLNATFAAGQYVYDNKLYGAQIGTDVGLLGPTNPFQVNFVGKIGVFSNETSGGTHSFLGGALDQSYTRKESVTSLVGEIGLSARYRINEHLSVSGGYRALWLSAMGLGSNAAAFSLVNPSLLTGTVPRGDVFFQGATAALEVRW